ncbi:MAG: leucine-rich repeat domain-containing protein, partial [Promethearchaeota archaeon]
ESNNLESLPESIKKLKSLQSLSLNNNKLEMILESITTLPSLHTLKLSYNNLTTLPESIENLESLQVLDLNSNKFSNLPESMYCLKNLIDISLGGNPWEEEWKDIEKKDIASILDFFRQKATINVFISYPIDESKFYRIKDFVDYLEKQKDIIRPYCYNEELKGSIDEWMEETVPKCQLMFFIGTQKSIFSTECTLEILLARQNNIPIIPIKGVDINWEDLANIGFKRGIGFEFEIKNFDKLCKKLYSYIYKFKREIDLTDKEHARYKKCILETICLIEEKLKSNIYKSVFEDKFAEIEALNQELKSGKIEFDKFFEKFSKFLRQNNLMKS